MFAASPGFHVIWDDMRMRPDYATGQVIPKACVRRFAQVSHQWVNWQG